MIYITGDTHNATDMSNLSSKNMKLCCMEQKVDFHDITTAIVLGDFGLPWYECPVDEKGIHPEDHTDRYLLKWYKEKPFTLLAVQGNHDNYDMIEKLPEVEMYGGKVLRLSENVYYLKRGEVYLVEGKRFLALGGAMSDDKSWRTPHESWWPQEEWTEAEREVLHSKLPDIQVDYVLSHTGPSAGIALTDDFFLNEKYLAEVRKDSTVVLNDEIDSKLSYKKWFFGHWHTDWGYEHFSESKYVPLCHQGIVL